MKANFKKASEIKPEDEAKQLKPSKIVAAPKIVPIDGSPITTLLNKDFCEKLGFSEFSVKLIAIKASNGNLVLNTKDISAREQLNRVAGCKTGRAYVKCPKAFKIEEGDEGPFIIKSKEMPDGSVRLTGIPHPLVIKEWEDNGLIDTTPFPAEENLIFRKTNNGWIANQGGNGIVIFPLKNWPIHEDPDNPGFSIPQNGILLRPALTACILIAGKPTEIRNLDMSGLTKYDLKNAEINVGPIFQNAEGFRILNSDYTAFEFLRDPIGKDGELIQIGHGLMDISSFKKNVENAIAEGKAWSTKTLRAMISLDFLSSNISKLKHISKLILKAGQSKYDQAFLNNVLNYVSIDDIRDIYLETMQETDRALDYFQKWSEWAIEEIKLRNKYGLKLRIPQPYGRKMRENQLVNLEPQVVAELILELLNAKAQEAKTPEQNTISKPEPPKSYKEMTDDEKAKLREMLRNTSEPAKVKATTKATTKANSSAVSDYPPVVEAVKPPLQTKTKKQSAKDKSKQTTKPEKAKGNQPIIESSAKTSGHVKVEEKLWGVANQQDQPTIGMIEGDKLTELSKRLPAATAVVDEPIPEEIPVGFVETVEETPAPTTKYPGEPRFKGNKIMLDCTKCGEEMIGTKSQWKKGILCSECRTLHRATHE